MSSSLRLFTIRGIDVRLHITFPLILLWAGLQFGLAAGSFSSALFGVVAVSILFVLVTLHELGHSFAAQHYGVSVRQIILTPLGGVAQLARMPNEPVQELVIAIAGPAVNFIIAILMGLLGLLAAIDISNPLLVVSGAGGFGFGMLFSYIFFYNILLALFNLLPAFPMDGGRILRALLALRLDYVRATEIAGLVGRVIALPMALYGLLNGGIILVLIALFIFMAGRQEVQLVQRRGLLRGYKVQQVYSPSAHRLSPSTSLQQAANLMLISGQSSFPVTDGDRLAGFVPNSALASALKTMAPYQPVSTVMRQDVVPVSPEDNLIDVQQRLAEEQLAALPVVANGHFLGLISIRQINSLLSMLMTTPDVVPRSQSV